MPVQPSKTAYVVTGNPDTVNVSPTDFTSLGHHLGELGLTIESRGRQYQGVQLDSGATSAPAAGVVAANQLAYWKDKSVYLVTNDPLQAIGGQTAQGFANEVAGVFRTAVTALATVQGFGSYCFILQKGQNIPVKGTGTFAAGDEVVANTSTPASDVTRSAAGTAVPNQRLGTARGALAGGNVNVDLDIPSIP